MTTQTRTKGPGRGGHRPDSGRKTNADKGLPLKQWTINRINIPPGVDYDEAVEYINRLSPDLRGLLLFGMLNRDEIRGLEPPKVQKVSKK